MSKAKRILVVDDDPDFLDYVSIVLTSAGYQVTTAPTAQAGLEMMKEDPPDLVIADVMMSYALDGWTISRKMQSDPRLRDIPVIMVSAVIGEGEDGFLPELSCYRMDVFLRKPVEPSVLLQHIAQLTQ